VWLTACSAPSWPAKSPRPRCWKRIVSWPFAISTRKHVLVISKEHYPDVAALAAADSGLLGELVNGAHRVAVDEGVSDTGYRLVFNTGAQAGQTVPHVHGHVLGGRSFSWPPG
jgi:diadenosine tetraphosphate (Ap4A) HIT family hydrolase